MGLRKEKPMDDDRFAVAPDTLGTARLLDVRRAPVYELAAHRIPGAEWRDPAQVDTWAGTLDRARPVVVYCVHGHEVSQGTAQRLREAGFDARYLRGGIEGWKSAGLELAPKA
jgi:Fe-Mn family superoxide dismutase